MSSANVELVRSIYAAWERGDFSSVEWAHPDIEYVVVDGPSPGSWTGLAGIAEAARDWLSAWEIYRVAADEYRELDDEAVLALNRRSGRAKRNGAEVGEMWSSGAQLFNVRDRKVIRFVDYFDRERALADLGLAPESDSPSVAGFHINGHPTLESTLPTGPHYPSRASFATDARASGDTMGVLACVWFRRRARATKGSSGVGEHAAAVPGSPGTRCQVRPPGSDLNGKHVVCACAAVAVWRAPAGDGLRSSPCFSRSQPDPCELL